MAEHMKFDPLVVENWQKLDLSSLKVLANGMTGQFNGSYKMALVDAFPELRFSAEWLGGVAEGTAKFLGSKTGLAISSPKRRGYWQERQNRREHFCEFARRQGFDPLSAGNWERLGWQQLKPLTRMVSLFDGGYKRAIADAFPELHFSPGWLGAQRTTNNENTCA